MQMLLSIRSHQYSTLTSILRYHARSQASTIHLTIQQKRCFSIPMQTNDSQDINVQYTSVVSQLYQVNRFTAVKLGLQNMMQLNNVLNDPCKALNVIHVAGTNGKGSVSYKISQALQAAGYRVGLFVSPHISCFRERIQINGNYISKADVVDHLQKIFYTAQKHKIPATFFELTTMLAFSYYKQSNVDFVVLETGLGGRLDATNIVKKPLLTVITSIGMDHTRILGSTINDIAREKAGIIKKNVPVVIGPQVPQSLIEQTASNLLAPVKPVQTQINFATSFDSENIAVARAAVEELSCKYPHIFSVDLNNKDIDAALQSRPMCRFELAQISFGDNEMNSKPLPVVLDVAHNAPAIERLVKQLKEIYPNMKFRFICGFSGDKDIAGALTSIFAAVESDSSRIYLVKADHPRGASLDEVNLALNSSLEGNIQSNINESKVAFPPEFSKMNSVTDGIRQATIDVQNSKDLSNELIVICGSVFLMREARIELGFSDEVDDKEIDAAFGKHFLSPEMRLTRAKKAL